MIYMPFQAAFIGHHIMRVEKRFFKRIRPHRPVVGENKFRSAAASLHFTATPRPSSRKGVDRRGRPRLSRFFQAAASVSLPVEITSHLITRHMSDKKYLDAL